MRTAKLFQERSFLFSILIFGCDGFFKQFIVFAVYGKMVESLLRYLIAIQLLEITLNSIQVHFGQKGFGSSSFIKIERHARLCNIARSCFQFLYMLPLNSFHMEYSNYISIQNTQNYLILVCYFSNLTHQFLLLNYSYLQQFFVNFLIKARMKINNYLSVYFFKNFKGRNVSAPKGVNLHKDYYKTLQIQNSAEEILIKKAYLRMAKKLHPDVNPNGHQQFTEIQEAYNVLCDKQLKCYYDKNNCFYPHTPNPSTGKSSQQSSDYRHQHFYESMKNKGSQDFNDYDFKQQRQQKNGKQYKQENGESQEEAKKRKRIEEEIELARMILFSRNPIWEKANAYMNYEDRQRYGQQKQKQFQELFPKDNFFASKWKKWI